MSLPLNESTSVFVKALKAIESVDKSHSYINEYTTAIINKLCSHKKLVDFLLVSVALRTPIAQFMVDLYTHCAWKHGVTINQFMDKSPALSSLSSDSKLRRLLRIHLSAYFEHVYEPVFPRKACNLDDDSDDDDEDDHNPLSSCYETGDTDEKHSCDGSDPFSMAAMVYFIDAIHSKLRSDPLNKTAQIDLVFLPESAAAINAEYLDSLGITYEALGADRDLFRMMKRFNQELKGEGYRRCIMLIVGVNNPATATVLVYEPLHHSSVPREIADCCEYAYISNTQSEFLPDHTVENSNALCLSLHIHRVAPQVRVERVYLSDGNCNVRVFKCSLKDTLVHFGVEVEEDVLGVDWEKSREFLDPQFDRFADSLFPNIELTSRSASPTLFFSETRHLSLENVECECAV